MAIETEPVPLSALEHFEYCARQCALILVDGIWGENEHTVRGQQFHRRVDSGLTSTERGVQTIRSMQLWSERYNIAGRADVVEVRDDSYLPVEFKAGVRHGMAAEVQVCAQALCLEEMFDVDVPEAAIWYGRPRRRTRLVLDAEIRQHTIATIRSVARLRFDKRLPPAVDDERCTHCQLHAACMPGRTAPGRPTVSEYLETTVFGLS